MFRIPLVFAALFALFPVPGVAQDPAAEALDGAWIVQVGEQTRDRFLIVEGSTRQQNRVVPASAKYGWIEGKGVPVRDWLAEVFGDSIRLSFVSGADSLVNVSFKVDETTVAGELRAKSGKTYPVRMTRIDGDELAALRAASATAKNTAQGAVPKLAKETKIYLVYVNSYDCPSCSWFRGIYLGNERKKLREMIPELDAIAFVDALLGTYKATLSPGVFPDELKWLGTANAKGGFPLKRRGVPFFAGVVGKRVVAQGHGVTGLETLVIPELRRAVAARSSTQ